MLLLSRNELQNHTFKSHNLPMNIYSYLNQNFGKGLFQNCTFFYCTLNSLNYFFFLFQELGSVVSWCWLGGMKLKCYQATIKIQIRGCWEWRPKATVVLRGNLVIYYNCPPFQYPQSNLTLSMVLLASNPVCLVGQRKYWNVTKATFKIWMINLFNCLLHLSLMPVIFNLLNKSSWQRKIENI